MCEATPLESEIKNKNGQNMGRLGKTRQEPLISSGEYVLKCTVVVVEVMPRGQKIPHRVQASSKKINK